MDARGEARNRSSSVTLYPGPRGFSRFFSARDERAAKQRSILRYWRKIEKNLWDQGIHAREIADKVDRFIDSVTHGQS